MRRNTEEIAICAVTFLAMLGCYLLLKHTSVDPENLRAAKIATIFGGGVLVAVVVESLHNKFHK